MSRQKRFYIAVDQGGVGLVAGLLKNAKINMTRFHKLTTIDAVQPGEPIKSSTSRKIIVSAKGLLSALCLQIA
jgi:hypothetical protein